jgi:hypothetical protein
MVSYSDEQIKTLIVGQWSIRKGHYGELFNKSQRVLKVRGMVLDILQV